ncbi:MAG: helix-turn-helix domain-containing protein [Zoogloeaceae bacterium]|jgi:predicted ArsR family transcriptional regulator|nr:helix-turn-helix domain-containing protein [Zoogloeaceae bacterium]
MEQKEIGLSEREVERFGVLERLRHGELSRVDASRSLGLSSRQVRRLLRRLERDGAAGLRSGRRGGSRTSGLTGGGVKG